MSPQTVPLEKLGKISQGATPSRYASDQGQSFRLVSVADLEDLYLRNTEAQIIIPVSTVESFERYQLQENDVVIAIRGTLLKSSVVTKELQGSISNQNTVFMRLQHNGINPLYLAVLLRSKYFKQLPSFKERQSTTTLPAIRVTDLRKLEVPLPDLRIQDHIGQLFLSLEQTKKVTLSALETRQNLADAALFEVLEG